MARSSRPWLVADIGGTQARFALVDGAGAPARNVVSLRVTDYTDPTAAVLDYYAGQGLDAARRPQLAAFAVASPVHDEPVRMTNSPWVISRREIATGIGAARLWLLNDFEALALALPALTGDDLQPLGGGPFNRALPMAVVGPGTGLGVASCIPSGDGWRALAAEGGHVTAAATDRFEAALIDALRDDYEHISAERLLSGIGLPVLYRGVCAVHGTAARTLNTEQIVAAGRSGADPDCAVTLATFCAMLGGFAGNVALTVGTRGGVFIAGGIAQHLAEVLPQSQFRARFEAKGRYRAYLAPVATALITAAQPALAGAAQELAFRAQSEGLS
jgi:glucokinase